MKIFLGIIAFLIVFFVTVIIVDTHRFVIERYFINSEKVNGSYKIVFLSDLHNKEYGKDNHKLLEAIRNEKPDAIYIGGDMLTARTSDSMSGSMNFIRALADDYPVYYGAGNHEFRIFLYPEDYGNMRDEFLDYMNKDGIHLLGNSFFDDKEKNIRIYGSEIDRIYYKRFHKTPMDSKYMEQILEKPDDEKFNILLAHNPIYFEEYAFWGADLILAGHVHGGLMRLPILGGVVSPMMTFFPKYDGGMFIEFCKTMIVSRGLGTHTIPIRIFNPGEIDVIEINK